MLLQEQRQQEAAWQYLPTISQTERGRTIMLDGNQLILFEGGKEYKIGIKKDTNGWKIGCTYINNEAMNEIITFVGRR